MAVLTNDERERIIEIERFRAEIREQLDAGGKKTGWYEWLAHPALLLVAGFVLTGVIGEKLTQHWKNEEAINQRTYLQQQRLLDKRYELLERTLSAVAQTNTAAEDILASRTWPNWSAGERREFKSRWQTTSREWRISSTILHQELGVYFANHQIPQTFGEIEDVREYLGNEITNLTRSGKLIKKDQETFMNQAHQHRDQIKSLLVKCGTLMASEVNPKPE
jgi:hypothetical protein